MQFRYEQELNNLSKFYGEHPRVTDHVLELEFINYIEIAVNYGVGLFEKSMDPHPTLFDNCTYNAQLEIVYA